MSIKTDALCKGGHVYTISPCPKERYVPWRYIGYRDGQRWGAFRSKKEFAKAVDLEPDLYQLPPLEGRNKIALDEARYAEMQGNRMLEDLQRALYFQKKEKGQTMFKPISALRFRPGDRVELEGSPGIVYVVEKVNGCNQPYVRREDGEKIGVNDGIYVWDERVRILPATAPIEGAPQ